jgi:hypothetical protein
MLIKTVIIIPVVLKTDFTSSVQMSEFFINYLKNSYTLTHTYILPFNFIDDLFNSEKNLFSLIETPGPKDLCLINPNIILNNFRIFNKGLFIVYNSFISNSIVYDITPSIANRQKSILFSLLSKKTSSLAGNIDCAENRFLKNSYKKSELSIVDKETVLENFKILKTNQLNLCEILIQNKHFTHFEPRRFYGNIDELPSHSLTTFFE